MENVLGEILGLFRRQEAREEAEPTIREQLEDVQRKMAQANNRFSMAEDETLVEAAIFELQALETRYRYLMRRAKLESGKAAG